jgi:hypothetical protein
MALLLLLAAPSLSPVPPQARPLPPWFYGVACYTEAPAIGAAQRATGSFDVYSSSGMAASDEDCLRLNEMLMRLHRGQ